MISVYQYPAAVLVILGGSTAAAIVVALIWGRNKRVWCRYLCPVNGVFGLLSKLAPVHFHVDRMAWNSWQKPVHTVLPYVDCAPLVPLRTLESNSLCHMCGRCSGFRGAVTLARRSPNHEIVNVAGSAPKPWETFLIVAGMMGIAAGAFHWSVSPWFIAAKQSVAAWLVGRDILWPLEMSAPWWILTNYPARNDVLTLLDGAMLLAHIFATATVLSASIYAALGLATVALGRWSWPRFHHLAQSLIPLAGCGIFLGLSALSVTLLRGEGLSLDWVDAVRISLIAGASLWSLWLASSIARRYSASGLRKLASTLAVAAAVATADVSSALLFWVW
jgi:hypothetical protein